VSALEALVQRGFVVDTMEISAPWRALPTVYERATDAISAVEHTLVASAHQSHSYSDGACLYFTFAGRPPEDEREQYYRAAWDAGQRAVLDGGGALSHHHGVGLNRARFVHDALGNGFDVLASVKRALDPHGILNPGKLGLPSPFGDLPWP
jgi:alkyldihydroxyacetonephosphate synthase